MSDETETDAPPLTVADLRPSVVAMALEMERKLRANARKGNRAAWRHDPPHHLLARVCEEVAEAARELRVEDKAQRMMDFAVHHLELAATTLETFGPHLTTIARDRGKLRAEVADVANMALMVADALGVYELPDSAE